jgi:hypothetical protein
MFTTLAQKHSCLNHSHLENICFDESSYLFRITFKNGACVLVVGHFTRSEW